MLLPQLLGVLKWCLKVFHMLPLNNQ
jgi:hypothetical protein